MNYKINGTPNSPYVILSNSLGSEMKMWDQLVPYLLPYFRVIQYDTRGHGGSENFEDSLPKTIETLAKDVIQLMDSLNISKAYFCGLSMGGLIGQHLGINYPDRFIKIALSNTAAKIGTAATWDDRIENLAKNGMQAIVNNTLERWFTDTFRNKNAEVLAVAKAMFLANQVSGYSNCCMAIRDADFRDQLANLSVETLIITGDEDPVTNVEQAQYLTDIIPNATLKVLPARHLAAMEVPDLFAEALITHFVGERTFDKGMHVRRTVLGNEHVDKASKNITEFNADFQKFITNYAWGEIWTRPGLSKHNRSLITLAMLIALNRPEEFKMHIKAAFNNGVSIDEIKEVIMQSAIYCGLPAANDAFHLAQEVFENLS